MVRHAFAHCPSHCAFFGTKANDDIIGYFARLCSTCGISLLPVAGYDSHAAFDARFAVVSFTFTLTAGRCIPDVRTHEIDLKYAGPAPVTVMLCTLSHRSGVIYMDSLNTFPPCIVFRVEPCTLTMKARSIVWAESRTPATLR